MDSDAILKGYAEFQQKNPGFGPLIVLTKEGEILLSSEPNVITPDQGKHIVDVWFHTKPAIELGDVRYPVLKWDEMQLAAKNVRGMGSLVGCKCKSGLYAVAKVKPECPLNALQASIELNRWSWTVI